MVLYRFQEHLLTSFPWEWSIEWTIFYNSFVNSVVLQVSALLFISSTVQFRYNGGTWLNYTCFFLNLWLAVERELCLRKIFGGSASSGSFLFYFHYPFHFTVATLKSIRVSMVDPNGGFEETTVQVSEGSTCESILSEVGITEFSRAVLYAQEVVYLRRSVRRRAVQCFDQATSNLLLIDTADGFVPRNSSWSQFARRFSLPEDSLPVTPRPMPRLFILTDTAVITLDQRGAFVSASSKELINRSFVSYILGIRSSSHYFWELIGDSFVNATSGEIFWRRGWIPKSPDKQHVLMLLKDGDVVPKIAVPKNKVIRVFRRAGVELKIDRGGLLKIAKSEAVFDLYLWDSPVKIESFDKDFTSAASKI